MTFFRQLVLIACGFAFAANSRAEDTVVGCAAPSSAFFQALANLSKDCKHPLCGRIIGTHVTAPTACVERAFKGDIDKALRSHGVVILGEEHDSAAHHQLQAAAVRDFATTGPSPTGVVFEQIRDDEQPGLDQFARMKESGTVADLKRLIAWDKSGWPKAIYDPLFEAVVAKRLPITAGDVPRAAMMKTAKEGAASLAPDLQKRLGLDKPLGPKSDAASIKEIEASHCGMLPKEAFAGMAYAQRYRDAHLADAVLRTVGDGASAILIAGTGHARSDRGVPWYVRLRAPGKPVVSVMLVEVEEGQNDPKAYAPQDPDGQPAADYLVFTPAVDHGDPCAKMRQK